MALRLPLKIQMSTLIIISIRGVLLFIGRGLLSGNIDSWSTDTKPSKPANQPLRGIKPTTVWNGVVAILQRGERVPLLAGLQARKEVIDLAVGTCLSITDKEKVRNMDSSATSLIATLLLPELLVAPAKRDIRIAFLRGGFKKARPVIVVNAKTSSPRKGKGKGGGEVLEIPDDGEYGGNIAGRRMRRL
ncbi:hypothetical protein K443DRAFT_126136 [Laccaria amethystina LaAM-08-1]|uniref:Uncharacterized protein n=1 Tax=Laccaria amethystina LaAM-08-1 TaxID=1095629 RepID=A0A0C9WTU2_9AGAR|nr:hypothetical protein K443DRAFT_126136 [Laccaria amethystina LaAM-08-1]